MDAWSIGFPVGIIMGALFMVFGGWFESKLDKAEIIKKAQLETLEEVDAMLSKVKLDGRNGWISVKDRLPKVAEPVLTLDSAGDQWVDQVNGSGRFGTDQGDWVATHWMPLPAAPNS